MSLLLMCGVAFSGKTTLARRIAAQCGHHRICLDELNAERGLGHIGPEDIPVHEWERSSHEAAARADALLAHAQPVVIDDTNNHRFLRDRYRAVAQRHGAPCLIVYLPFTLERGLERIAANRIEPARGDFPEHLYRFHVSQFEPPAHDEPTIVFEPGEDPIQWARQHEHRLRRGATIA
ncbi:MAG TPA: ATP-binding protein [Albitalea sp.]|nr:ATP-binding protein [Albitalea sp.]